MKILCDILPQTVLIAIPFNVLNQDSDENKRCIYPAFV